jgi:hypothetical protein
MTNTLSMKARLVVAVMALAVALAVSSSFAADEALARWCEPHPIYGFPCADGLG